MTAKPATQTKLRRSQRREFTIPIRVFGISVKGRDFTEDCVCLRVSRHGALIRLKHYLIPDDTIRILNLHTKKEATFRVVSQVNDPPESAWADWGVEALDLNQDIWNS